MRQKDKTETWYVHYMYDKFHVKVMTLACEDLHKQTNKQILTTIKSGAINCGIIFHRHIAPPFFLTLCQSWLQFTVALVHQLYVDIYQSNTPHFNQFPAEKIKEGWWHICGFDTFFRPQQRVCLSRSLVSSSSFPLSLSSIFYLFIILLELLTHVPQQQPLLTV